MNNNKRFKGRALKRHTKFYFLGKEQDKNLHVAWLFGRSFRFFPFVRSYYSFIFTRQIFLALPNVVTAFRFIPFFC